jgi:ribosomal protein L32
MKHQDNERRKELYVDHQLDRSELPKCSNCKEMVVFRDSLCTECYDNSPYSCATTGCLREADGETNVCPAHARHN